MRAKIGEIVYCAISDQLCMMSICTQTKLRLVCGRSVSILHGDTYDMLFILIR